MISHDSWTVENQNFAKFGFGYNNNTKMDGFLSRDVWLIMVFKFHRFDRNWRKCSIFPNFLGRREKWKKSWKDLSSWLFIPIFRPLLLLSSSWFHLVLLSRWQTGRKTFKVGRNLAENSAVRQICQKNKSRQWQLNFGENWSFDGFDKNFGKLAVCQIRHIWRFLANLTEFRRKLDHSQICRHFWGIQIKKILLNIVRQ